MTLLLTLLFLWMALLTRHTFFGKERLSQAGKKIFLFAIILLFLQTTYTLEALNILDRDPRITLFLQVWIFWALLSLTFQTLKQGRIVLCMDVLFFVLFLAFLLFPGHFLATLTWLPMLLFTLTALFLNLAQKHRDPLYQSFSHTLHSGTLFLGLGILIQNVFSHPHAPLIASVFYAWAHFQFCSLFQNFFTLRAKEADWKWWSHVLTFFLSATLLFMLFFLLLSYPVQTALILTTSLLALFEILIKAVDFLLKRFNRLFSSSLFDYLERLDQCRNYLQTLLKTPEFLAFLSGLFGEFFESRQISIVILPENEAQGFRILSLNKDQTFRLPEEARQLKAHFTREGVFRLDLTSEKEQNGGMEPALSRLKNTENISLLVKIRTHGNNLYLLGITPGALSPETAFHLHSSSLPLGETLERILLFEHKKIQCLEQLQKERQKLDIEELKKQNLTLQQAFERVRRMQTELIHKEKQAALTKFSISLDDEISNPLNNILITIQYHMEKMKSADYLSAVHREKILNIVITQSLRIKEILEKIRNLSHRYSKDAPPTSDSPLL